MSFFQNKKLFQSDCCVGVDISEANIRFAQMNNQPKNRLAKLGKISLLNNQSSTDAIFNSTEISQAIQQAYDLFDFDSKKIIYTIPEKYVNHRQIIIDKISENEIENIVKWEINSEMDIPADEFYYTWETVVLPIEDNKLIIDFLFLPKKIVKTLDKIFLNLNLKPQGYEIESRAHLNYLTRTTKIDKHSTLVIDIGEKITNFMIYQDDKVKLSVESAFSIDLIVDTLAKTLNISNEEAGKIIDNNGLGTVFNDDYIFQAIQPILAGIIQQAKNLEDFYLSQDDKNASIAKMMIVGGGAKIKGLAKYLAFQLEKELIFLMKK
jgi:type IV pilus assembly protein PilM